MVCGVSECGFGGCLVKVCLGVAITHSLTPAALSIFSLTELVLLV